MKTKIKTIDIQAKEWFDKVNGNSYFSARVTINFGMKTENTVIVPFQYGYGDAYCHESFKTLKELKLIAIAGNPTYSAYIHQNKITMRAYIQRDCLKRDVVNFVK